MRRCFLLLGLFGAMPAMAQDFQAPNTLLWGAVGTPWTASVRGEAWLADQASGELGVGMLGEAAPVGFDWAIRWRPDFACILCGQRDMITLGLGPGGLVSAPIDDDVWALSVGGDLAGNFVHWFSPTLGLTISGRIGVGAGFVDFDPSGSELDVWMFGGAGLAF